MFPRVQEQPPRPSEGNTTATLEEGKSNGVGTGLKPVADTPQPDDRVTTVHIKPAPARGLQNRAIVAPYAGGGAEAASFAPVVLIRPPSAEPTTVQPRMRGEDKRREGVNMRRISDYGDPFFTPITVVRPRGDGALQRASCWHSLSMIT